MFKTTRLVAATLGALMVLSPLAAAGEMFDDATTGAPEPNAFDAAYAAAQGFWSNVHHTAADDDSKFGAGSFALLHGHGPGQGELSDAKGTATLANTLPHIDMIHTNWYGALIASDPNDAAQGNLEQRFSYPGFIVLTVLYGYYNECFQGSYVLSGANTGEGGAESVNSPVWCGNPAHVMDTSSKRALLNDEFVPIYWTHGGSAPQVRDHRGEEDGTSHLSGTTMVYGEILEDLSVAEIPTIPVTNPVDMHALYDNFDEDCNAGGEYAHECTTTATFPLWNQRITCTAEDDANRNEEGGADYSRGNTCITAGLAPSMPDNPLQGLVNFHDTPLGQTATPDDNSPQQIGDQILSLDPCFGLRQDADANGCETTATTITESLQYADSV
ncbi:MAG TPA: hypothetical protein VNZ52_14120, partial [Candidatus Thermoplasmatota archaeon]|nr:hypothetical protein [Candidatus Thermoplasmatota archaeon]